MSLKTLIFSAVLLLSFGAYPQQDRITPQITTLTSVKVDCSPEVFVEDSELEELGKSGRLVVKILNPLETDITITDINVYWPNWLNLSENPTPIPKLIYSKEAMLIKWDFIEHIDIHSFYDLWNILSYNYTGQDKGIVEVCYEFGGQHLPTKGVMSTSPFLLKPVAPPLVILLGGSLGVFIVVILYWIFAKKLALAYAPWALLNLFGGVLAVAVLLFLKPQDLGSVIGIDIELLDFKGGLMAGMSFLVIARALISWGGMEWPSEKASKP